MKIPTYFGLTALILAIGLYLFFKFNEVEDIKEVNTSEYNMTSEGIAIKGFDPVNYFKANVGSKGKEEFSTKWKGSTWQFVSEENMNEFILNPDKYAPLFGGYCSFAVTTGNTASIDPTVFVIYEKNLLLFNGPDAKLAFMVDPETSLITAHKQWNQTHGE